MHLTLVAPLRSIHLFQVDDCIYASPRPVVISTSHLHQQLVLTGGSIVSDFTHNLQIPATLCSGSYLALG